MQNYSEQSFHNQTLNDIKYLDIDTGRFNKMPMIVKKHPTYISVHGYFSNNKPNHIILSRHIIEKQYPSSISFLIYMLQNHRTHNHYLCLDTWNWLPNQKNDPKLFVSYHPKRYQIFYSLYHDVVNPSMYPLCYGIIQRLNIDSNSVDRKSVV